MRGVGSYGSCAVPVVSVLGGYHETWQFGITLFYGLGILRIGRKTKSNIIIHNVGR
jgi:hypothetical protein